MAASGNSDPCEILPWDSEFFGRRIARVTSTRLDEDRVAQIEAWCAEHAVDCLYLLADSGDPRTTILAVSHGFLPVDVRVTLELPLIADARAAFPATAALRVRQARPEDLEALKAIARTAHRDTRFYFDPGFPNTRCDDLYALWIEKSCGEFADAVFVAEHASRPSGYVTCHVECGHGKGRIGLVGVAEHARGHGAGKALVRRACAWLGKHGCERVQVVTQGRNVPAQRLYERVGFLTRSAQPWFHKWFERT